MNHVSHQVRKSGEDKTPMNAKMSGNPGPQRGRAPCQSDWPF